MNRIFAAILFLLLLPLAGCSDVLLQRDDPASGAPGRSELRLETSIRDASSSSSLEGKGSISGTDFPNGSPIGLFASCHDSTQTPPANYVPHQIGYNNILATRKTASGSGWSFNNTVLGLTYDRFYVTTREDSVTVDIYAYAPYLSSVARPDSIPFLQSNNYDLMWATENADPTTNKALSPDGTPKTVPLHFQHALCRLRFNFKTENTGSNHYVDYIHIKKAGNLSTPLYKSGVFNATSGTFSEMVEVGTDSLCVASSWSNFYGYSLTSEAFSSKDAYTPFDILLYETEVQPDGDLLVIFSIDGFRYSHRITREEVQHRDEHGDPLSTPVYGFRRGYTYNFNFILDNYVHLQNIVIQSEWTPGSIYVNI